jgi:hypothetical protein
VIKERKKKVERITTGGREEEIRNCEKKRKSVRDEDMLKIVPRKIPTGLLLIYV